MSIFTRLRHLLGGQKELSPEDLAREEELKKIIENVCFNNVNEFFDFKVEI